VVAIALIIVLLGSCTVSEVSRLSSTGVFGLGTLEKCAGYCVQKIEVVGGEKCVEFSSGMAKVCFAAKEQIVEKGTYKKPSFILRDLNPS